jgi:hypothetical protein
MMRISGEAGAGNREDRCGFGALSGLYDAPSDRKRTSGLSGAARASAPHLRVPAVVR